MAPEIVEIFASYPAPVRAKLMTLRQLIFDAAGRDETIGPLTETLKWGEPAYLTEATKSGSTIRLAWKPSDPHTFGMYFICSTNLVDSFRALFPDEFSYAGNRAIIFKNTDMITCDPLTTCISMALTYHRDKKS